MADTFEQALQRILDAAVTDVWTALPGVVASYDAASQRVQVQPAPADVDGPLPLLAGVPVVFPGAGAAGITWPIAKGDTGLLVFCSRSIERWLASGDAGDPQSERHHHVGDAVFIPGLRSSGGVLASVPTADLEIREPTGGLVKVGQGATAFAARQGDASEVVIGPIQGAAFQAWLIGAAAWVSGGMVGPPPPNYALQGTITGGSATVKVK